MINVHIVEKISLSKMGSERGGFQLMLIMSLLGLYFDAAVVFDIKFSTIFRYVTAK